MNFETPLIKAKLVSRYKRFLADVEFEDGQVATAHCANPGAMLGLKDPGMTVFVSKAQQGKLPYRWELAEVDGALVGINTSWPNKIVSEALDNKVIQQCVSYDNHKREVKFGQSRFDFLLTQIDLPDCFVEVKNVHLKRDDNLAEFPDSVTVRGLKHLNELSDAVNQGYRAIMLYVVQRTDCSSFSFASDIDKNYAEGAKKAKEAGVEFMAYTCDVTEKSLLVKSEIPIIWA